MYDYKYEYQKAFDDAVSQGMDEESAHRFASDALADRSGAIIDAAMEHERDASVEYCDYEM